MMVRVNITLIGLIGQKISKLKVMDLILLSGRKPFYIPHEEYQKIKAMDSFIESNADTKGKEYSWWMSIEKHKDGYRIVPNSIAFSKQKITGATVLNKEEWIAEGIESGVIRGKNLYCHSHNTMSSNPSGQPDVMQNLASGQAGNDYTHMNLMASPEKGFSFFGMLITNYAGNYYAEIWEVIKGFNGKYMKKKMLLTPDNTLGVESFDTEQVVCYEEPFLEPLLIKRQVCDVKIESPVIPEHAELTSLLNASIVQRPVTTHPTTVFNYDSYKGNSYNYENNYKGLEEPTDTHIYYVEDTKLFYTLWGFNQVLKQLWNSYCIKEPARCVANDLGSSYWANGMTHNEITGRYFTTDRLVYVKNWCETQQKVCNINLNKELKKNVEKQESETKTAGSNIKLNTNKESVNSFSKFIHEVYMPEVDFKGDYVYFEKTLTPLQSVRYAELSSDETVLNIWTKLCKIDFGIHKNPNVNYMYYVLSLSEKMYISSVVKGDKYPVTHEVINQLFDNNKMKLGFLNSKADGMFDTDDLRYIEYLREERLNVDQDSVELDSNKLAYLTDWANRLVKYSNIPTFVSYCKKTMEFDKTFTSRAEQDMWDYGYGDI